MGDVINYDYGNKSQWRRWVWNRIAERADVRDGIAATIAHHTRRQPGWDAP